MSRGHTVELFATLSDLIGSLSDAEQVEPLRYYAIHSSDPAPVPEESIAALGSKLDQTRLGYYLVSRAGVVVGAREVAPRSGDVWYSVDASVNPDSVLLYTGARYANVLTPGRLAIGSDTAESQSLFRLLSKCYRRRSRRVKSYWVGTEALTMLRSGVRLVCNETASPIYDLRED